MSDFINPKYTFKVYRCSAKKMKTFEIWKQKCYSPAKNEFFDRSKKTHFGLMIIKSNKHNHLLISAERTTLGLTMYRERTHVFTFPITHYKFISKILAWVYQGAALIIQIWYKRQYRLNILRMYMKNWLWRPSCLDGTIGINCIVSWNLINNFIKEANFHLEI